MYSRRMIMGDLGRRYRRGWCWETERGATTPAMRAVLSAVFVGVLLLVVDDGFGWVITCALATILLVMHTVVTIQSASLADRDEASGDWSPGGRHR